MRLTQLDLLPIQSIKSISQRSLAQYWAGLAEGLSIPSLGDFKPEERMHDPKQLTIWQVEHGANQFKLRSLHQGAHVQEVFAAVWSKKTLDDVVPAFAFEFAMATASECVASSCAIYTVVTTLDEAGDEVDCERLLLPLGRAGKVEQLVASLQLISLMGNFNRKTILQRFEKLSTLKIAGKIVR